MKKYLLILPIISVLLISCDKSSKEGAAKEEVTEKAAITSENFYENYLTTADIEKITGLTGVKLIPRNPAIGAGGNLNFATADDDLILMIQIVSRSYYGGYKQHYFKESIIGLGNEAMKGATIPDCPENQVVFTKGNSCIALTMFANMKEMKNNSITPMLTIEKAIELAKIIDSRI